MCGIAGILDRKGSGSISLSGVQAMCSALRHRGPDGSGSFVSSDARVGLGHTRLAIIDPESRGQQPMCEAGRYYIVFNGMIYNFRELRAELSRSGEIFSTECDTEVILKLFKREGSSCVKRLRGMFAFAIWDDLQKECFFARDRFGMKPLYYRQEGDVLIFASEVRALVRGFEGSSRPNPVAVFGFLLSGSVPEPHSLVEGVAAFPPASHGVWNARGFTITPYWELRFAPSECSRAEAVERIRAALEDSVRHHWISDVQAGLYLSGGVDSTALLALSKQAQVGRVATFSLAFEEKPLDEREVIRRTVREFDTEHYELEVRPSDTRALLPEYFHALDQPTIDGFNTYCVARLAREKGVKVALSGLGADELFGGYSTFGRFSSTMRGMRMLRPIPFVMPVAAWAMQQQRALPALKRVADILTYGISPARVLSSLRAVFSVNDAYRYTRRFLEIYEFDEHIPSLAALYDAVLPSTEIAPGQCEGDQVSYLELTRYMKNQLLRDGDVTSHAHGLELRLPFLDHKLVELLLTIPPHIRLAPKKSLLVEAVREIPTWVVARRKQPFLFPFEQWLRHEWRKEFELNAFEPESMASLNWSQRWSLKSLEHWKQSILA